MNFWQWFDRHPVQGWILIGLVVVLVVVVGDELLRRVGRR